MRPAYLFQSLFSRLSSNYFWYFGLLGLIMPFLSVYLDFHHFSSLEIGEILAISTATKILGPWLWASMADKRQIHLMIIRLGGLLMCVLFASLYWQQSYYYILIVFTLFSLIYASILPQLEVFSQYAIRNRTKIYGRVRLWGSIGFIVCSVLAGKIIDLFSPDVFVLIGFCIIVGFIISSYRTPNLLIKPAKTTTDHSILASLMQRNIVVFLIAGILLQISFGPYYGFFALYLNDLNYSGSSVGLFLAISVIAEIIIFIIAGKLFTLISIKTALIMSLLLTSIRWLLLATLAQSPFYLILGQVLHAAGFGLYHCASILFLQKSFSSSQQSQAQALYLGIVYGVGGAIGAYYAGAMWQNGVFAKQTLFVATFFSFVGGFILFTLFKNRAKT